MTDYGGVLGAEEDFQMQVSNVREMYPQDRSRYLGKERKGTWFAAMHEEGV